MLDRDQFQDLIIDATLEELGMYSQAASELMLGTALQESRLIYLTQIDGDADPYDDAMGVFQTERKTHDDLWDNWLKYRQSTAELLLKVCQLPARPDASTLVWNLRYAAAMARLVYRRVKAPLPLAGDLVGQARYWKAYYNTASGHGTVEQYIANWRRVHGAG